MDDKKEKRAKFNPELQPKSHVLKISYWIGADEDPEWVVDSVEETDSNETFDTATVTGHRFVTRAV